MDFRLWSKWAITMQIHYIYIYIKSILLYTLFLRQIDYAVAYQV